MFDHDVARILQLRFGTPSLCKQLSCMQTPQTVTAHLPVNAISPFFTARTHMFVYKRAQVRVVRYSAMSAM